MTLNITAAITRADISDRPAAGGLTVFVFRCRPPNVEHKKHLKQNVSLISWTLFVYTSYVCLYSESEFFIFLAL